MYFDTHSHLQFDDYVDISDELVLMKEYDVQYSTVVGSDYEESKKGVEVAKKYVNIFASVGIHPDEVVKIKDIGVEVAKIEKLIIDNRKDIIALGEIGFDYFRLNEGNEEILKEKQKKLFFAQAELALKYNLPVIIHTRNSKDDTLKYIYKSGLKKFVIHCFTENYDFSRKIMDYSDEAFFGFSGIITFKNSKDIQDTVSKIPLSRILVETDAPFLTPEPFRGKKINTSAYVKFVLDKIKTLRSETPEEIEKNIFDNSLRFYGI